MIGAPTLRVESEVLGSIGTLKHQRLLDLLHQLREEVLPGGVLVQQAAGVRGPLAVLKPAQDQEAGGQEAGTEAGGRKWRCSPPLPDRQSACGVKVRPPDQL